jgi:hypothetical protein
MEGVESGQGGPSSGPTDGGGQRDQQSSDFQLRFDSLQTKGPQASNENKVQQLPLGLSSSLKFLEENAR